MKKHALYIVYPSGTTFSRVWDNDDFEQRKEVALKIKEALDRNALVVAGLEDYQEPTLAHKLLDVGYLHYERRHSPSQ